jgi:hypothetical protein
VKRCPQCKKRKATSGFYVLKSGKLSCWCRSCCNLKARAFYTANRDRYLAASKLRRLLNPEDGRKRAREWAKNNPERARAASRKLYWKDPERSRLYHRKKSKEWRLRNLDRARALDRASNRRRYQENPGYFRAYIDKNRRENMPAAVRRNRAWRERHPDRWAAISARAQLSQNSSVPTHLWPEGLVTAVVANRRLKRVIKTP